MKRRKLITRECFKKVHNLTSLGVPLSKVMRQYDLNISRPALDRLIKLHQELFERGPQEVRDSLAPMWVDQDGPWIQEQPDNQKYEGYFPLGKWHDTDD